VQSCNILSPRRLGTVTGFGTLNLNNNFINGGGAGPGPYTVEGLRVSGGLSLEVVGNKVVLFAGAAQANTGALMTLAANVDPVLGFNAVTIDGNILHPRNQERGILFEAGSTTALGAITGNTFIRSGGTAALIDYPGQASFDNYNAPEVLNYSIESNAGVVESRATLKGRIGTSTSTTSATYVELEPLNNGEVTAMDQSIRWAQQIDLLDLNAPMLTGETITNTGTGATAKIVYSEYDGGIFLGGSPLTVYIADLSGAFDSGQCTTNGGATFSLSNALRARWRYSANDPRQQVVVAAISFETNEGKDETTFLAPGNGVGPETACELPVSTRNDSVGGTATLVCSRRFVQGDIVNFYLRSQGPSAVTIRSLVVTAS